MISRGIIMDSEKKSSIKTDKTIGLSEGEGEDCESIEPDDASTGDEYTAEDFELVELTDTPTGDQGHNFLLGPRIRLSHREINQLKKVLDAQFHGNDHRTATIGYYDIPASISDLPGFELNASDPANDRKLKQIPVIVEEFNERVLVKIEPHDLSGVGGIRIREAIIQDLVNRALVSNNIEKNYRDVDVCANLSVRGRKQMLLGFFSRKDPGSHQNAFIKVAGEGSLTRWEPRDGPQSFFNDTICAMAVTVMSALFEYGLRTGKINNSEQATQLILKSEAIKGIFDTLLKMEDDRITYLVAQVNDQKDTILGLTSTSDKEPSPQ